MPERYDIDKLLVMWDERIDTLEGKRLNDQQMADEFINFFIYTRIAIYELNERTKGPVAQRSEQ